MWRQWVDKLYPSSKRTYLIMVAAVGVIGGLVAINLLSPVPPTGDSDDGVVEGEQQKYPVHRDIVATVFWVGEDADSSNDYIHNRSSYWTKDWVRTFGGVDDPDCRVGYDPCGFTPKENPFYFALPFGERSDGERKPESELMHIPWYEKNTERGTTLLKNRWVKIMHQGRAAYAQWQDVGPFGEDDIDYVFGGARPAEERAGIDLSPATAKYLDVNGRANVDWQFVDSSEVPDGPWTVTITKSGPMY